MFREAAYCSGFLYLTRNPADWTAAQKPVPRSIDSHYRAHRMFPRAALKRRHVSFSTAGRRCDGAHARIAPGLDF
jgi:hypothetical protein